MTIVLVPCGRGKWSPLLMQLSGRAMREGALLIQPGERLTIGGVVYRVREVRP